MTLDSVRIHRHYFVQGIQRDITDEIIKLGFKEK